MQRFNLSTHKRQNDRKLMMSMKSMTSLFTKVCVYDRPHENAKTVFSKNLQITDECEVCEVTVYESMRLRPSTR